MKISKWLIWILFYLFLVHSKRSRSRCCLNFANISTRQHSRSSIPNHSLVTTWLYIVYIGIWCWFVGNSVIFFLFRLRSIFMWKRSNVELCYEFFFGYFFWIGHFLNESLMFWRCSLQSRVIFFLSYRHSCIDCSQSDMLSIFVGSKMNLSYECLCNYKDI